jgi:hypothetical protein
MERITRKGCDALDLSALWPCMAQVGCIPISEMFSQDRSSNQVRERVEQERSHGIW